MRMKCCSINKAEKVNEAVFDLAKLSLDCWVFYTDVIISMNLCINYDSSSYNTGDVWENTLSVLNC